MGAKTLDEDHIMYASMDAYLCLNIYNGWMKKQSPVSGSSKEVSVKRKRKRDKDEVEDMDSDSEYGGSAVAHAGSSIVSSRLVA